MLKLTFPNGQTDHVRPTLFKFVRGKIVRGSSTGPCMGRIRGGRWCHNEEERSLRRMWQAMQRAAALAVERHSQESVSGSRRKGKG